MIRTVSVPRHDRLGCTPGGNCCDECRGHSLQDTACDQDGNCYDTTTGMLLSAPLTTGPGCAPGVSSCAASMSSSGIMYALGAGLLIAAIELFKRK